MPYVDVPITGGSGYKTVWVTDEEVAKTSTSNLITGGGGLVKTLLGGDSWPASVNALWDTGAQAAGVLLGAQKSEAKQAAKDAKIEGGTAAASVWWKSPWVIGGGVALAVLVLWRVLK